MSGASPKVLIAEVTAQAGNAGKVRELLADYGRVVRREEGNRVFTCHQVEGRPEKFVVYEIYADQAAFEAHLAAPENALLNGKLKQLVEGSGSVLTFLTPFE